MNSITRKSSKRTVVGVAMVSAIVAASAVGAVGAGKNLSVFGGAARHSGDQTGTVRSAIDGGRADNVILFIGDGMGQSEITSARNYAYGADGNLPGIDALPLTGDY